MERFTISHWQSLIKKGFSVPEVYCRLAAYEDTGLTPEEITALLKQPNDPLTLEELREMVGEPVWVDEFGESGRWALVLFSNAHYIAPHGHVIYHWENYGKTWLAYRCKPEEAVKC